MDAIVVDAVSKHYGETKALNSISFSVEAGELFGLIGPDGAGKSTLFRILTTLVLPDHGKCWVSGFDVVSQYQDVRKIVGYMPGRFSLYQDLSIKENIDFFATIFGTSLDENYDLIRDIYLQIEPFKNRLAGNLSGGMKQKLALCCALIHKPKVLFLDEPTTGVDAVSRKEFWEILKGLKERNIAIMVSTPYMDEASLCDRIALIQNGNILKVATTNQVIDQFEKTLFAVQCSSIYKSLEILRRLPMVESALPFGDSIHLILNSKLERRELLALLNNKGLKIQSLQVITPTIEDIFLDLSMPEDRLNN